MILSDQRTIDEYLYSIKEHKEHLRVGTRGRKTFYLKCHAIVIIMIFHSSFDSAN